MNTVELIKSMCKERKIPISKLEKDLGFSNGYIGQLRKGVVPNDRLKKIADYFKVSMEYLVTGKETEFSVETARKDVALSNMNEHLKTYMLKLAELDKAKQDAIFALIDTYEKKGE